MVAVRFLQICAAGRLDTALARSLGRLLMKQSSLPEAAGALTRKMQQGTRSCVIKIRYDGRLQSCLPLSSNVVQLFRWPRQKLPTARPQKWRHLRMRHLVAASVRDMMTYSSRRGSGIGIALIGLQTKGTPVEDANSATLSSR